LHYSHPGFKKMLLNDCVMDKHDEQAIAIGISKACETGAKVPKAKI